jgi:hypothetical protein
MSSWFPFRDDPRFAMRAVLVLLCFALAHPLHSSEKSSPQSYGHGIQVTVPAAEQELVSALREVVDDGIIRGSKEYNKDEYVSGAEQAQSTPAFTRWIGPGQVFYKVRKNALDPRNFKDSGDSGTLAVRYIVRHVDDHQTNLQIDAVFLDDFHHRVHLSNGSVEAAEYTNIQDRLAKAKQERQEIAAAEQRKQREIADKEAQQKRAQVDMELALARHPGETLEDHVRRLHRQAERIVTAPGAQLKSAPFHSASSLTTVPAGSHVLIVITTRYWYGVETQDGQHGWMHSSQLEALP